MLRILADHPDDTMTPDNLAFITYFFYGRTYFHNS